MSLFTAILTGLAMGVVFGFALEKSRVFEPGMIVGQMQLRNFVMLKIFLSAVVTGLVILAVLYGFGIVKLHPKGTLFIADIAGGLLLGAGITLAGACPGTVAAQIGAGYKDSWFTLAGGVLGALVFAYLEPTLAPLLKLADAGKLTLDVVTGLPFWLLALGFAALLVGFLVWLERKTAWRNEMGPDGDGLPAA
ncbi:MAG: YeeE/YedE thiosulfate transporter family protein [Oceanibaculum nanhaiense]|uniref:YeeE/YedE thiosulfate transporter family protein n=1 Tax=Oceanibaculum nanhaiense TaxID=1909734 RepID=UPI0025A381DF|nr:YeeE/YedE thiosulfate transporter family protein [Oceanibaculum nanhaiense]MDM7946464.1 YeeE/YedE thiosulfate transporter family protein [Oceanibaculum nanhaiense]